MMCAGAFCYSFREIMKNQEIGPHWANLYGWPDTASEADIKECKKLGVQPTVYKGCAMLAMYATPDESVRPSKKVTAMAQDPEEAKYVLKCDVFQASSQHASIDPLRNE